MDVRKMRNELLGKRLVAALESRNMEAYYVETKEEAVKKALELIPKGSSINMGVNSLLPGIRSILLIRLIRNISVIWGKGCLLKCL